MERIAITAVGVVSSIGRGLDAFSKGLFEGRSGSRDLREFFGESFRDIPVRYGSVVDTAELPSRSEFASGGYVHRSVRFGVDAVHQLRDQLGDLDVRSASIHSGIGVGVLCPDLDEVRRYGPRPMLAAYEAELVPGVKQDLPIPNWRHVDVGTELLGRILGLEGLPGTYSGTCSASTQACIAACECIAAGETYAFGGGHDSLFGAHGIYIMKGLGTLTDEPNIRPFDLYRDGTMLGEGAVYFMFENLEHARSRGAHVYAEVLGWSSSLDGYHLTSPDPSGKAAERMMVSALHHADLAPNRVDYVNAHGTSTMLNDVVEAEVIQRALQGHRPYVSSTKAQVGHLIAACGSIGMAACLAALDQQRVPPNPFLTHPDPDCDLRLAPATATAAPLEHILCNSFGFGGQNSCVVLKRATLDAGGQ